MAETKKKYSGPTIRVEQLSSPSRRHWSQRETLRGLGLNRIRRQNDVPDTPATRGMLAKVAHLIRVIPR